MTWHFAWEGMVSVQIALLLTKVAHCSRLSYFIIFYILMREMRDERFAILFPMWNDPVGMALVNAVTPCSVACWLMASTSIFNLTAIRIPDAEMRMRHELKIALRCLHHVLVACAQPSGTDESQARFNILALRGGRLRRARRQSASNFAHF